ncbi:hypothetical protein KKHLCK_10210 [Candidatus Electrothrix laxa]
MVLRRVKINPVRIFSGQTICPRNRKSGGSVGARAQGKKKGVSS